MGGYIQVGGHSPLSSIYGVAADHDLCFSVVLPSGEFITASPTQNPSIFFALGGGGGSTFGVVTSVTIKAYLDFPVTGLSFATSAAETTLDNFWAGLRACFDYFIPFSDAETYSYFCMFPGPEPVFSMQPFFAPNKSAAETEALLAPWLANLAALGIFVNVTYNTYPGSSLAGARRSPRKASGQTT